MDRKEARTAWIVAGILAVLLIIAVIFWMTAEKDLDQVLQEGKEDITVVRDRIEADCHATDEASQKRCDDHLEDLADILKEFNEDIDDATEDTASGTPEQPQ